MPFDTPSDSGIRTRLSQFYQISKPSIVFLLDFVAISALLIAYLDPNYITNPLTFSVIIGLFFAGTFSSAGSAALNCYFDRDIDIKMERTKHRATATGQLSPATTLNFGIIMIIFGVGILRLKTHLGDLSKATGILEIITGICFATVFLSGIGILALLPLELLELLLLYKVVSKIRLN